MGHTVPVDGEDGLGDLVARVLDPLDEGALHQGLVDRVDDGRRTAHGEHVHDRQRPQAQARHVHLIENVEKQSKIKTLELSSAAGQSE